MNFSNYGDLSMSLSSVLYRCVDRLSFLKPYLTMSGVDRIYLIVESNYNIDFELSEYLRKKFDFFGVVFEFMLSE